jgi:hypothetical protein
MRLRKDVWHLKGVGSALAERHPRGERRTLDRRVFYPTRGPPELIGGALPDSANPLK